MSGHEIAPTKGAEEASSRNSRFALGAAFEDRDNVGKYALRQGYKGIEGIGKVATSSRLP